MKANNNYYPHMREHRETSENQRPRLHDAFICPICGTAKTHHRLYGYRCSVNPEHDEMARNMSEKQLAEARAKWQDLK